MSDRFAKLNDFIVQKLAASNLPGLSLAVVEGGDIAYRRAFGYRDLEAGKAATPETLYGIGSVTKSFTCLALMQLQEQGLLSIDDELDDYVELGIKPHGEPLRLRHLMSHTSGIPALAYAEAVIRRGTGAADKRLPIADVDDLLAFMEEADEWVETAPGERWFYLNEGYVLLGAVIERVSGQSYNDYVVDNILEPLGMERSIFSKEQFDQDPDAAVPYVVDSDKNCLPREYQFGKITSDGGLISSVEDMARYILMYLNGGVLEGARLVEESSLEEMMEPRVKTPALAPGLFGEKLTHTREYCYGLHTIGDFFGRTVVGHGGSVLIATAQMAFIPEENIGIMLLANGSGYPLGHLAEYGLALALGEDPGQLPFRRVELALEKLEGVYETYRGTVRVNIRKAGDYLVYESKDRHQEQSTPLVPAELDENGGRFFVLQGGSRTPVEFRCTDDGVELLYERYKLRRIGALP
jgi:CubicO group peptidase (beta-lactamase class C family)